MKTVNAENRKNRHKKEENSFTSMKLSRFRPTNFSGRQKEEMGQMTTTVFYHPDLFLNTQPKLS